VAIIAEIGIDMTVFGNAERLAAAVLNQTDTESR
jgi:hypothetical protein